MTSSFLRPISEKEMKERSSFQATVKRIAFFIPNLHLSHIEGQSKIGMTLAQHLSYRGVKVFIITNNQDRNFPQIESKGENLKVLTIPGAATYSTYIGNLGTIALATKRFDPDILHGHGLAAVPYVAFLGRLLRKPTIQTLYDLSRPTPYVQARLHWNIPLWRITARLLEFAPFLVDHVLCSSNFIRNYIEDSGVPSKKITVLPYGVEEIWFDVSKTAVLTHNTEGATVVYWGDARVETGIETLLDALPEIATFAPNANFVFAIRYWDSKYRKKVGALADRFSVRVLNYPTNRHISQIVSSADLIVLPYNTTTLYPPLVLVESMLAGKAVITTDVEANREIIGDDARGLLIERGNSHILAMTVASMLSDNERRQDMAAKARSFVFSLYDWNNVLRKLLDIYDKVLIRSRSHSQRLLAR